MKRSAPLTRKVPLKPGKPLAPGKGLTRKKPLRAKPRKALTQAEIHRDVVIREIGCVVCRLRGLGKVECAKHHTLTTGQHGNGKRRGEAYTVGLCDYHHQGAQVIGTALARSLYPARGPSYADNAREFRAEYPDALLLEAQERFINEWRTGVIA
jgi:hypothetical protein